METTNKHTLNAITFVALATLSISAGADVSFPGMVDGTAYLTYDQAAWATMKALSPRLDMKGLPIGVSEAEPGGHLEQTSDTFGNRFLYPQLFRSHDESASIKLSMLASDKKIADGTADPEAVAQWRLFDPAQRVPTAQPVGGWAMPIDSFKQGLDSLDYVSSMPEVWGSGYNPSNYNPEPGASPTLSISLGGSMRVASDFISPGGSIWFAGLDVRLDSWATGEPKWYIGSNAYALSSGSIFELINPVFGVNELGLMTLEADYKWGDSAWSTFLQFVGNPEIDSKVLGHISFNPAASTAPVPLPSAVWLFGSALLGLIGVKRRGYTG